MINIKNKIFIKILKNLLNKIIIVKKVKNNYLLERKLFKMIKIKKNKKYHCNKFNR